MLSTQAIRVFHDNRNDNLGECRSSVSGRDQNLINIFLSTFAGLGLPRTASVQVDRVASHKDVYQAIQDRLPCALDDLAITTYDGLAFPSESHQLISSLLKTPGDDFLGLRLSVKVLGGKGGFGSQLRAAGGRMSAKRKKKASDTGGSNRNLDGRRLRTVTEAKALAEYLSIKPGMDEKEKADRKVRLQNIIQSADDKQEEIRGFGKGKLVEQWVEDKDELVERTRQAVLNTNASDISRNNLSCYKEPDRNGKIDSTVAESIPSEARSSEREVAPFLGFDDDLEYLSESS